nr:MAG TPA: hypothetical protein [Caudoviricetes sp.]
MNFIFDSPVRFGMCVLCYFLTSVSTTFFRYFQK